MRTKTNRNLKIVTGMLRIRLLRVIVLALLGTMNVQWAAAQDVTTSLQSLCFMENLR